MLGYTIPILDWSSDAGSYKAIPIDVTDQRYLDPLVRLADYGVAGESFYARRDGGNWPYGTRIEGSLTDLWCRRLVARKLVCVNEQLRSFGCEVFVWDGYRPIECQRGLWTFFSAEAARLMPSASKEELQAYVLKYVSDPTRFVRTDPTTWPVHTSGAAIDLTLKDLLTGQLLDMGAPFDDMRDISHSDHFEREVLSARSKQTDTICRNRRLLHWCMCREGFVNYPFEFWHFDWGNQMYVHNMHLLGGNAPVSAWFGYMEPPPESA